MYDGDVVGAGHAIARPKWSLAHTFGAPNPRQGCGA